MSKEDTITHDGQVVDILNDKYKVKIIAKSACASCHAKSVCNPSDQEEKIIDAISYENLKINDFVTVELEERLGWKALFYGIIIPMVVMVTVLFSFSAVKGELFSGIAALLSLIPYYLLIYIFRERIEKEFVFTAKKGLKGFNTFDTIKLNKI